MSFSHRLLPLQGGFWALFSSEERSQASPQGGNVARIDLRSGGGQKFSILVFLSGRVRWQLGGPGSLGPPLWGRGGAHALSLSSLGDEQPTKNWSGQEESDCLIETKQSDGSVARISQILTHP